MQEESKNLQDVQQQTSSQKLAASNQQSCQPHQHCQHDLNSCDPQPQENGSYDSYHPHNNQFMNDPEEMRHFVDIIQTFFNYKNNSMKDVNRMIHNFQTIQHQFNYLKYSLKDRQEKSIQAIDLNYKFLLQIVYGYKDLIKIEKDEKGQETFTEFQVSHNNISKLRSTIKQFVRDWSVEGKQERDMCYTPIKEEFNKYFPKPFDNEGNRIKVLFPGAGLGRLVFDFAAEGYGAQGNEFSYFMLLSSNFILNNTDNQFQFQIQPYIHVFSNNFSEADPYKVIKIPDVNPQDFINEDSDLSMVAGEFVEVYDKQVGEWNSVISCFFIDTANNIIQYILTIHKCLKKGGVWINFGPLLYHYADMQNEVSIELSWEEVKHIILQVGFEIKNEEVKQSTYASEKKSMMQVVYNCIFFTAVKL